MSDGAAAAIVMSAEKAKSLGIKPLARYLSFATAGYKQALSRSYNATANSSGQIVIAFTQGGADNPFINGIEVVSQTPVTPTITPSPSADGASRPRSAKSACRRRLLVPYKPYMRYVVYCIKLVRSIAPW